MLKLTPTLFEELDHLARTSAGVPVEVVPAETMLGAFARINPIVSPLVVDVANPDGPGSRAEAAVMQIANEIDLNAFRTCPRPELDYSAIPAEDIYCFLILHEAAHARQAFNGMDAVMTFGNADRRTLGLASAAMEILADREAWEHLYPGKPLPQRPYDAEQLAEILALLEQYRELFTRRNNRRPMTTEPGKMIPLSHVLDGIPWAS
ncbi:MAG: hypothetical protein R6X15_05270 [Pseudomonadota bacterium]